MFSGMNEILLIAALVLALIFIPRLNATRKAGRPGVSSAATSGIALSDRQRLAILASLIWLAFWAFHYEPWQREWKLFVYIGAGPILFTWGLWWTLKGRRNR
jgi:drug/metabolite transporter (DMT)-like permease